MQRLALREVWWPLAVAVAWVLLRSQQVVEQLLDRHSRKPITFTTVATYAADLKAGGQHTTPKFENSEAAFDELRHHLETGEIEIVGTPFVRVGDREGSLGSRWETSRRSLTPRSVHLSPTTITEIFVSSRATGARHTVLHEPICAAIATFWSEAQHWLGASLRKERNSRTSRPMLSSPHCVLKTSPSTLPTNLHPVPIHRTKLAVQHRHGSGGGESI